MPLKLFAVCAGPNHQIHQNVHLTAGKHTLRIRVMAKGEAIFQCTFKPAPSLRSMLKIYPPKYAPDLLDGKQLSNWLQVGVSNFGTRTLHDLRFKSVGDGSAALIESPQSDSRNSGALLPGQTRMFRLQFSVRDPGVEGEKEHCVRFPLEVEAGQGDKAARASGEVYHAKTQINLRCRHSQQSFLLSFLDHDGSVAVAAAILRCTAGLVLSSFLYPDCFALLCFAVRFYSHSFSLWSAW